MIRFLILSVLFSLLATAPVSAGVTIHYEGWAVSPGAVDKILKIVKAEAKSNRWKVSNASAKSGRLDRIVHEKNKLYQGKVRGLVVHINDHCDPLTIQFGKDLFMQNYVKTQFAGPDVHIQIIKLLKAIQPYFRKLEIEDEGEYWDKPDRAVLEGHMKEIDKMIAETKMKNPKAVGPVKAAGRMLDLVE